jgi:hypothetical protein
MFARFSTNPVRRRNSFSGNAMKRLPRANDHAAAVAPLREDGDDIGSEMIAAV